MSYSKLDFGKDLQQKLRETNDIVELARWAYDIYLAYSIELEDGLQEVIMQIVSMEEGPEFEFTTDELIGFTENLMEQSS